VQVVAVLLGILVVGLVADPARAGSASRPWSAEPPARATEDGDPASGRVGTTARSSTPEGAWDDGPRGGGEDIRERLERLSEEVDTLREFVDELTAQVSKTRPALHSFRLPDTITFADEAVPLDRWDVAERLEREFYLALGDPAQVILWLKRSARYFPYIEQELRTAGLPDDLKYVAVVESALRPKAFSWARASGIWQFIRDTARRYGLRVSSSWDERRDPARSTAAAIAYLTDLYRQFRSWPLALAGYNAGEARVEEAQTRQGVTAYYQLALPTETERYFFRILAAKLILQNPGRYGFEVPPEERYAPHATESASLSVVGYVEVRELAQAAGSFYRELRAMNPAIMGERLPAGRYELRLPKEQQRRFAENLSELERTMAARTVRRVEYTVRPGDTLAGIAERFGVSVGALQTWNRSARGRYIHPGDRLVIERSRAAEPD